MNKNGVNVAPPLNEALAREVDKILNGALKKRELGRTDPVTVGIDEDGDEVIFVFWQNPDDDRDYINERYLAESSAMAIAKAALRSILTRHT